MLQKILFHLLQTDYDRFFVTNRFPKLKSLMQCTSAMAALNKRDAANKDGDTILVNAVKFKLDGESPGCELGYLPCEIEQERVPETPGAKETIYYIGPREIDC